MQIDQLPADAPTKKSPDDDESQSSQSTAVNRPAAYDDAEVQAPLRLGDPTMVVSTIDAIDPMQQIKLSGQLATAIADKNTEEIYRLYQELGVHPFEAHKVAMSAKYGKDLFSKMTDEEIDDHERLERDFHQSQKSNVMQKAPEIDIESTAPYHRFTNGGPDNGTGYMMFSDDEDRVDSYGKNHYTFDPVEMPASNVIDAGSDKFKNALISALNEDDNFLKEYNTTADNLSEEANPDDIVNSAGLWDAPDLVSFVWDKVMEPNGWKAVITNDGAIVFDESFVKKVDPLLDAVSPMDRIKLVGQLSAALTALKSAENPLDRVKSAAQVATLIRQLEDSAESTQAAAVEDDGLSDDPNSPNYRYRDTGYIADSRKELAADVIYTARKTGQRLRATDIDFEAVEQNPRQAADLITKQNLFGKTDWTALQENGMDPAAGFLIDKIFASIGPSPANDGPLGRKDYAVGLEAIRDRLEDKLTVADVMDVINEIRDELDGTMLNSDEAERYELIREEAAELTASIRAMRAERDAAYEVMSKARGAKSSLEWDIEKRKKRKWAISNDLLAQLKQVDDEYEAANKAWGDVIQKTKQPMEEKDSRSRELYGEADALKKIARARNLMENQTTRSWLTFGERFFKLLNYRSYKGSDSFAGHVTNAKAGRIQDWSWADKERPTQPKGATKQEINFQMKVAETYDRKGGSPIEVSGTKALEDMLGLRAVQSGNWVLKDTNSAKFHVESTAAAFSDLADILGTDVNAVGMGGRLGMAFGARGRGGKGAARAHYESVHRVINLTKMGGGGCLGHEWFHAIDNLLHELVNQETAGKKDEFVTVNPALLPAGPIQDAVINLRKAMLDGDIRPAEAHTYSAADIKNAKYNIDGRNLLFPKMIRDAGSAAAAVIAINNYFSTSNMTPRTKKNWLAWRTLAVAYYHNDEVKTNEDGVFETSLATGPAGSSFAKEAVRLDNGDFSKYWSCREEMAARAFQAYIEDKLKAEDRRNDYLSVYAENKYHFDPLFGIQWNPFPEGDERERINSAFDKLFAAIRDEQVFEKAIQNKPLMDSIFSISPE